MGIMGSMGLGVSGGGVGLIVVLSIVGEMSGVRGEVGGLSGMVCCGRKMGKGVGEYSS